MQKIRGILTDYDKIAIVPKSKWNYYLSVL